MSHCDNGSRRFRVVDMSYVLVSVFCVELRGFGVCSDLFLLFDKFLNGIIFSLAHTTYVLCWNIKVIVF